MRFILSLILLLPLAMIAGEEVVEIVAEETEGGMPVWLQAIIGVVVTIITTVVVPWLRKITKKQDADNKENLLRWVRDQALIITANLAERDLPVLAESITRGDVSSKKDVKQLLYALGDKALEQVKMQFKDQGVDVVKELGEKGIRRTIRWASDKVSPFPGKESAAALLEGGAERLLDHGTEWVREKYMSDPKEVLSAPAS
jgi:hypothetical protein